VVAPFLVPADVDPASTALVDGGTGEPVSYGRLGVAVAELRERLASRSRGVVLLWARPEVATVAAFLGSVEAGHAVLLADGGLPPAAASRLVARYRPEWIAGAGPVPDPDDYDAGSAVGEPPLWRRRRPDDPPPHPDLALLLSTSGSTGSPKLVRLARRAVESNARAIAVALDIGPDERAVTSLPLHYSYGASVLDSHLSAGATTVLTPLSVVERGFWNAFAEHRCTAFAGVPSTYRMLERMRFGRLDLPTLRSMTQAGGRLEPAEVLRFHELLASRGRRFYVMYGQTEATARIAVLPPSSLPERAGTVGRAIPGGVLTILTPGGETRAPGEVGEVVYRGPNVMLGYAESRVDLIRGDELGGVLHTGDVGRFGDDGLLEIVGRNRGFVKLYGVRVNLADVEACAAVGGPAAAVPADERIVVFCERGSERELAADRERIAAGMALPPQAVELRRVEALPLLATGKVDYRELERWTT